MDQWELEQLWEAGYDAFYSGAECPLQFGEPGYATWWAGHMSAEEEAAR